MLSINIPVFNIEVNDLVLQLVQQAEKLSAPFEIRVYDDGSEEKIKELNRNIVKFPQVIYTEFENNLGRAAIRNKMGFDSKYDYLLFIDADSKVTSDNYLSVFIENVKPDCVVCGGTVYQKEKPSEKEKMLRWTYGTKREAISAQKRNSFKGFIITSNNFLIEKKTYGQVHFRENILNYGHEDTLLGYDLFKQGMKILHIDNPVEHTGLEDSEVFLQKTRKALENLKYITEEVVKNDKDFLNQVYFLNRYNSITNRLPKIFLKIFYWMFQPLLEKHLKGESPKMFWFDVYKLGYFSSITKP